MSYLYRGVSKELDLKNEGKLRPKGNQEKIVMKVGDPTIKVDGTWVIGQSEKNTLRAHQLESPFYQGCLISATRDKNIAIHFATSGNVEKGFLYIIDEQKLSKFGVTPFEKKYLENEHEKEVSLKAKDCGDLPVGIIHQKKSVEPNIKR